MSLFAYFYIKMHIVNQNAKCLSVTQERLQLNRCQIKSIIICLSKQITKRNTGSSYIYFLENLSYYIATTMTKRVRSYYVMIYQKPSLYQTILNFCLRILHRVFGDLLHIKLVTTKYDKLSYTKKIYNLKTITKRLFYRQNFSTRMSSRHFGEIKSSVQSTCFAFLKVFINFNHSKSVLLLTGLIVSEICNQFYILIYLKSCNFLYKSRYISNKKSILGCCLGMFR